MPSLEGDFPPFLLLFNVNLFFFLNILLFLAELVLCFCTWVVSAVSGGCSLVAMSRLLIEVASLVAEQRLQDSQQLWCKGLVAL